VNRAIASFLSVVLALALSSGLLANTDIAVTTTSPHDIRVLPGESTQVDIIVANLGPDSTNATLTAQVYSIYAGYVVSLPQPNCGALTQSGSDGVTYSVFLASFPPGEIRTCNFIVERTTSDYAASDLPIYWIASAANDANSANDWVGFDIGSLIDVSIDLEPRSFDIDANGYANETVQLHVANHGPSDVAQFVVGACTDHYFPGFNLTGDFEGGCGLPGWTPNCVDYGFGFLMPALNTQTEISCSIHLRSLLPYAGPLRFGIQTGDLINPATGGGSLLDIQPDDNYAVLTLAPFEDGVFANGFEPLTFVSMPHAPTIVADR
jgi:hypothetical protein